MKSVTKNSVKVWIAVDLVVLVAAFFHLIRSPAEALVAGAVIILMLYRIKWKSDVLVLTDRDIFIRNRFTTTTEIVPISDVDRYALFDSVTTGEQLLFIKENKVIASVYCSNYCNKKEILEFFDRKLSDRVGQRHDGE